MPEPGAEPRRAWRVPLVLAALALAVRAWNPGPTTQTFDEQYWLARSEVFGDALADGRWDDATAVSDEVVTLPGVTTMWAGTLGDRLARAGDGLGVSGPVPDDMGTSAPTLRASRLVVAAGVAVGIGLLVHVLGLLIGRRAAAIAGGLLAVDPFFVGHTSILGTDGLVATSAALAVAAFAAALLRSDTEATAPSRGLLVLAGVAAGLATLTKLNAPLAFVPGLLAVIVLDLARRRAATGEGAPALRVRLRRPLGALAVAAGVAVVVCVALWPALVTDLGVQVDAMAASGDMVGSGHRQFFLGKAVSHPDWRYYPVAFATRATPWMLLGLVGALPVLVRAGRAGRLSAGARAVLAVAAVATGSYALTLVSTAKTFDRYSLPLWPWAAVVVGLAVAEVADRVRVPTGTVRAAGWAALAVTTLITVARAPYAISWTNPLLGGGPAAEERILLGWGEGYEQLGATIAEREGTDGCEDFEVLIPTGRFGVAFPCGVVVNAHHPDDGRPLRYVIRYVNERQRGRTDDPARGRAPIEVVTIDGVTYAELWRGPDS
jgi:hypothetical protein